MGPDPYPGGSDLIWDKWHDTIYSPRMKSILKELGLMPSNNAIAKLSSVDTNKFLKVFRKLKSTFNYKKVSENYGEIEKIVQICEMKGDVFKAIDFLDKLGYKLRSMLGKKYVGVDDVMSIDKIINSENDKLLKTFGYLKQLGYKGVKDYYDLRKLVSISEIKNNGAYPDLGFIIKNKGQVSESKVERNLFSNKRIKWINVDSIEKRANALLKEQLASLYIDNACVYRKGIKTFVRYFSELGCEEKESALRGIFNCGYENKEIISWLDENESDLVRKVGLEP